MKKILLILVIVVFVFPCYNYAHEQTYRVDIKDILITYKHLTKKDFGWGVPESLRGSMYTSYSRETVFWVYDSSLKNYVIYMNYRIIITSEQEKKISRKER